MIRSVLAIALGRIAGFASRLIGRGGTAIPGLVAEKVDPRLLERLSAGVSDGVILVTGTNGKTTTTKMLVSALIADGRTVVTNPTGSNLERGVVTALIDRASWRGRVTADTAVFEADEAAARRIAMRLRPRLVVATNLSRDQLDRYGELDTTASHIAAAVERAHHAVINADDPLVAALAADRDVDTFGAVERIRRSMPSDRALHGGEEAADARPDVTVEVADTAATGSGQTVTLTHEGSRVMMRLAVPGVYNAYNAAAAFAAAMRLGVPSDTAVRAFEAMPAPFGRGQVVEYRGRRVVVVLVKNPAGFDQAIRLLADLHEAVPVLVAINDEIADGRDVSWLWDAHVEELAATDHHLGTSGTRAADMALRLKYAGAHAWAEPALRDAIDRIVGIVDEGGTVYVVPTYTAMLEALDVLLPGMSRREAWT